MQNDSDNYLNQTVNNSFMPKITSTELIDKRNVKGRKGASIHWSDDSVNMCLDSENKCNRYSRHRDNDSNISRNEEIDPKYLVRTVPPPIQESLLFFSSTESLNELVLNVNEPCLCNTSFCRCQEDYLTGCTNDISRMTMIDATAINSTLLEKAFRSRGVSPRYKENESPVLVENLLASDEEDGKDNLEITKYAYKYVSNLKQKRTKITALQVNNAQQHELAQGQPKKSQIRLTANRSHVVWPGSLLHDKNVKSFSLTLNSSPERTAMLTIDQSEDKFLFSNESGSVCQKNLDIVLHPKKASKIFIKFRPSDSSFNSGTVRVLIEGHKYKIDLFGYMDSARIQLVGFEGQPLSDNSGDQLLVRTVEQSIDQSKLFGYGLTSINVCNVGVRTAFVALFSHEKDVTFEPRAFLVIPNSTVEVLVSWTNGVRRSVEPTNRISFIFIHVDEEIRRACRQNCFEFRPNQKYDIFSTLQLFSELPDEKHFRLNEIPRTDWRPYLIKQLNAGYRECLINVIPANSDIKMEKNESVLTIEEQTRSTMTELGSLSNFKKLPFYINRVENFIDSLRDQLKGIVVLKNLIRFPVTRVSTVSYQAILIQNCNLFSVYFEIMPLSRSSPLMAPKSSDTLTSSTRDNSNKAGSLSPENGQSSRHQMVGRALCNSVCTIKIGLKEKHVTVKPLESLLVPVTFRPVALGLIQCKCVMKFQCHESNLFFVKEIDFIGEAGHTTEIESQPSEDGARSIPGITVMSNVVEFGEIGPERTVSRSLLLKSRFQRSKHLFISRLSPPFEFRRSDKVTLDPGPSALKIFFNSKMASVGLNEAVLLLSDEVGNCTHVMLRALLKKQPPSTRLRGSSPSLTAL